MVSPLSILFPLYFYPQNCTISQDACAWKPLYDALDAYPAVNFTIVINPASGPGNETFPDDNYISGISALNSYANAQTIGYISSLRAKKSQDDFEREVDRYVNWTSSPDGDIAMHGIFIDDVTRDAANVTYYAKLSNYTREAFGNSGLDSEARVVLNPGTTTPEAFFESMQQDIFVTFEGNYADMWDPFTIFTDPVYKNTPRDRQAAIIHDFSGSTADLVNVTNTVGPELKKMRFVFVTDLPEYNVTLPTAWETFVAAVNGTNAFVETQPE